MRVQEAENAVAYPVKCPCGFAPLFASLHQLFPHTSLSSVFTQHSFPSVPACEEAGKVLWGEHQCPQTHSPAMHSAWLQQHSFNHPLLLCFFSFRQSFGKHQHAFLCWGLWYGTAQPGPNCTELTHEQTHGLACHTLPSAVVHENRVFRLLQMASIIWHSSFHGCGWSELTPLQGARQSASQTWSSCCLLSQQLMPLLG